MRYSQLFGGTLREAPAEVHAEGERWLTRAGYLAVSSQGRHWLPLGVRLRQRAQARLEAGLRALGGQPLDLAAAPGVCWQGWARVADALARSRLTSYRQLPRLVYQAHREGDAWVLDAAVFCDADERTTWAARLAAVVDAWLGQSHVGEEHTASWLADAEEGEARHLRCPACGWEGDRGRTRAGWAAAAREALLPLEEVATPDCTTIAELAAYLGVPAVRTAKAVFRVANITHQPKLVFAILRGDTELSESKLSHLLNAPLRPATDDDIRAVGAVPGYASPVGLQHPDMLVVVDELAAVSPNLVAGANREGFHLRNVNLGRDYRADLVADIADPAPGTPCPACGAPLTAQAALGIAMIDGLPEPQTTCLDRHGKRSTVAVAGMHVHLDSWLVWLAGQHHDDQGLVWPLAWAPFALHLVSLRGGEEAAASLYETASQQGVAVFWDDRDVSPGVKFTDADLMGIPWRATVSKRSLAAGGVELKRRDREERRVVPPEAIWETLGQEAQPSAIRSK